MSEPTHVGCYGSGVQYANVFGEFSSRPSPPRRGRKMVAVRKHLFSLTVFGGKARPISGYGMSENHGENHNDQPRENQVKRRGAQPGFEQFPLFPEKIPDQDVSGGIGRRPRDVKKEKSAPLHFRHPGQQIHHDGRKQKDEPRDKNRPGAMTFEKSLRPL